MRDWVLRFNADGPDGLATRKAPGRTSILNDEQRTRLAGIVEAARSRRRMALYAGGLSIWGNGHGTSSSSPSRATRHTRGRELRAMGYRQLSARPRHRSQKGNDIVDSKKLRCPPGEDQAKAPRGRPIELWWQDVARVGQQTKLIRRWASHGTRPSATNGTQADVIKPSTLSARHDACSRDPWITGLPTQRSARGFVPRHAYESGMTAIADMLMQRLAAEPGHT